MIIIGDVHGKINQYSDLLKYYKGESTIQVGDLGFKKHHEWHLKNLDSYKHKVNFGNHDDYTFLNEKHSLGNFSYKDDIFSIRGAFSIDKVYRIESIDWWSNEELSYGEMQEAIDAFIKQRPSIVISHDCPHSVREYLFKITDKSITTNGLQTMFEIHQPNLWLFGHHHKSKEKVINGTKFICLAELQCYKL